MMPKEKQALIYIKWHDAYANSSWFTPEQLETEIKDKIFIVEEIGWLVAEDDKEIHLVARRSTQDRGEDITEYGSYQRIPKTWILKRIELEIGQVR